MALVCIGCTLLAALPTNVLLFRRRTKAAFLLALFNTSLAFFLFSFQVRALNLTFNIHLMNNCFLGPRKDNFTGRLTISFLT